MSAASLEQLIETEEFDQQLARELNRKSLRRLLSVVGGHRWLLAGAGSLLILGFLAKMTEPWLFGRAIDLAILPGRVESLYWIVGVYLLVETVRASSLAAQSYLFAMLGQKVMQELRIRLFAHLQRLPMTYYDRTPAGKLITRVTNDIASLADLFSAGFVMIVFNILTVVGTIVWLAALNWRLAIAATLILPLLVFVSRRLSLRLQSAYRNARTRLSALNAFIAENIQGMRIVQLFNREPLHSERYARVNQRYCDAQVESIQTYALMQPAITLSEGISVGLVLFAGGALVLGLFPGLPVGSSGLEIGLLVSFTTYSMSLFQPVREIADKWNIFLSGMASAERVFSILDWNPEGGLVDLEREVEPYRELRGEIRFEGVWFAYLGEPGEERWVLKDFSLHVKPGQKVGVVGHTGAGKTTLISLLMRFYEPQKGRILLDGRDIREYDKRRLRATLGLIQQDVFLFSGSLHENFTLGRLQSLADPSLREAARGLGVESWLGEAGSRKLNERGTNLSLGERQVVSFLRALVAKPRLWILDEATANVDSGTEERLAREFDRASAGATAITIAHRLATVKECDLILVLHRGEILEQGDHETLVSRDGLYARMYRYQASVRATEGSQRV